MVKPMSGHWRGRAAARGWLAWLVWMLGAGGCYLVHERPGEGDRETFSTSQGIVVGEPLPPRDEVLEQCPRELREIRQSPIPLDMLFVVDNSASMVEEQQALAEQFPRLIEALTRGDRDGDGSVDFPPVVDLHLGVVSSDMGVGGVSGIQGCEGLGDDGVLQHRGRPNAGTSCQRQFPSFLSYRAEESGADAAGLAQDFACIALLGTEGCGFEQQLEAGLKALWPSQNAAVGGGGTIEAEQITFLGSIRGLGREGHGSDTSFLRHGTPSLIAVVVVSDEEDCSSRDTSHFEPDRYLRPGHPLAGQGLNVRCFYNPENRYSLQRYFDGFRLLRPGAEHLVTYAAIVGVPEDLVSPRARAEVDFSDEQQRNAYYDRILDDDRMTERLDPELAETAIQNLEPSCESPSGKAYPPRRFVELARAFGEAAIVQSICQQDFRPAVDAIVDKLGETIEVAVCTDAASVDVASVDGAP